MAQKPKKNILSSIFSGVRIMPSRHTLKLTSSSEDPERRDLAFGVDFGTTAIKIIQISVIKQVPQVERLIVENIPLDLQTNPRDWKKVSAEIFKKIIVSHKIKGRMVASLPASLTQVRTIILPQMPPDEMRKAVQWDIKQSNPGAGDFSFDFYVLEDLAGSGGDIKVVAVSCDKKEVVDILSLMQSLNLTPAAVDLNPQATVAALVHNGQIDNNQVVIVLEFGCNNCSLNVVINNQIYLTRDLAVSGRSLTQAISDHRQISFEEAERLKTTLGLMGSEAAGNSEINEAAAIAVNEALWLHLENLIQEIDYTFKFFLHQVMLMSRANKLDKIILSGGSANLNRFSSYLSSYLSVPVEVANPLKGLVLSPAVEEQLLTDTTQNFDSLAPRLSVAAGLALWEMQ